MKLHTTAKTTAMPTAKKRTAPPITHTFVDDGRIPNNPLPLVLYRGAIDLSGSPDPERVIEKIFAANGWGDMWRNGVYPYVHYHSMIHEAMAVARGHAKVRFGGDNGQAIDITPGDVVVLPAGTGHQRLMASADLVVVGRAANTIFAAAARPSMPRRAPRFRKYRSPRPIRCSDRWGR
jgi:uncharacterized protein YjlB